MAIGMMRDRSADDGNLRRSEGGHGGGIDLSGGPAPAEAPAQNIGENNLPDLLDYLNESGDKWTNDGTGVTLTVDFPGLASDLPDGLQPYAAPLNQFQVAFAPFDQPRIDAAMLALQQWGEVANIDFEFADPGEDANIYFFGRSFTDGGAFSSGVDETNGSAIRMNVDDPGNGWNTMAPGGAGYHYLLHEIGHSLGLSHPGDYDVGVEVTYDDDALYAQDTTMHTIMSYFGGENTGFDANGHATNLITLRAHDMYVIQQMYGANWETRNTDTVYGYNASGLGNASYYDFTNLADHFGPQLTIWDGGGDNDWLDLSGDYHDSWIDLAPGAFSSTHGMDNNLSLAFDPGGGPGTMYIENARGGSGDDTIYGNELDNILEGLGGRDLINGLAGDDSLYGGNGNDTLVGEGGTDFFDGGNGVDTVSYAYSAGSWDIVLATGFVAGTATAGGGVESLLRIENVIGAHGDDSITGSSVANTLDGNDGNDTLAGVDGDDLLIGGRDDDSLLGGAGDDSLIGGRKSNSAQSGDDSLRGGAGDDTARGGDGDDSLWGGADDDVLEGDDGHDTVYGNAGDDTLRGGKGDDYVSAGDGDDYIASVSFSGGGMEDGDDTLLGGRGDDTVVGGYGDDVLNGNQGNDELKGGYGNDTVVASAGNDTVMGGNGSDTYDFAWSDSDWHVDLLAGGASGGSSFATLANVEVIRAGSGDDDINGDHEVNTLIAGAGDDSVDGAGGDDVLLGEAGSDTLKGGAGDDIVSGGTGIDTASYVGASGGVSVDLMLDNVAQNTFGAGVDTLIDIERLQGSNFADILSGNDEGNWLSGYGGDDWLFGRGGDDWLRGGHGDDLLEGGTGTNILQGDEGIDTASYFFATGGVIVDLTAEGAQDTQGAGTDLLLGIENLIGSFHADFLTGDEGNNRLTGGEGNDILSGGEGNDSLIGGEDNDVLIGGLGNDYIDGGAGIDWAYFTGAPGGVEVDLRAGAQSTGLGTDQIVNVENLYGSLGDDDLRGDDNANEIWGSNGDDTIYGAGGDDTIRGDGGDDQIYIGADEPFSAPDDLLPVQPVTDDDFDLMRARVGGDGDGTQLLTSDMVYRSPDGSLAILADGDGQHALPTVGDELEAPAGSGADTVQFTNNWGDDEVHGFSVGVDKLDFTLIGAIDDVIDLTITNTVEGALISYGSNSVLLHGVFQSDLSDSDFLV
ncbi:M10 family metallopeptidase C-terminal domain-containing protein [Acuticoccus sediminis]|uniref:M10 family metallopeptidase C-terminal domain-containing protein n=1 Tax=Acuticoccus sediminis TaxID=2184697 RepID=UPI001CFD8C74|nr:M10 family metallopeptidase C-terminal domain-containing protein [Acuticoccus sediminis]